MAHLAFTLLLFVLLTGPFSHCFAYSTRKELRRKEVNQETLIQLRRPNTTNRIHPSQVLQISWRPRVFLFKGFLTDEECNHLIALAQSGREALAGVAEDSGKTGDKKLLTSSESFVGLDDSILARIEERISAWTFLPKENGEPLKILHYGSEEAGDRLDYFSNRSALSQAEPLMATVILYLSNVSRGGEVLFPNSEIKNKIWPECGKTSVVLRPIKGNAILFFTVHPNTSPDKSSPHSRCPVLEGNMWAATKLFHLRSFSSELSSNHDGAECTDEDENCARWAAAGECQRNPVFMTGSPDYYGTCRKSCNVC